ncbi:hypothetical protein [Yoonia maritima]|uniref:hypothetical protein n=1 Tax=Yoonia maritima TaxID=1435347 RepID=UPI000D1093E9|nr:hypothetical protein [Yoonia maritima]
MTDLMQLGRLRQLRTNTAKRLEAAVIVARSAVVTADAVSHRAAQDLLDWRDGRQARLVKNLAEAGNHRDAHKQISVVYAARATEQANEARLYRADVAAQNAMVQARDDRDVLIQQHSQAVRKTEILEQLLRVMQRREDQRQELLEEDDLPLRPLGKAITPQVRVPLSPTGVVV